LSFPEQTLHSEVCNKFITLRTFTMIHIASRVRFAKQSLRALIKSSSLLTGFVFRPRHNLDQEVKGEIFNDVRRRVFILMFSQTNTDIVFSF
jgi:hypothetical protein